MSQVGKIIDDDGSRSLRIALDSNSNIVFIGKRGRIFTAQRVKALVALWILLLACAVALVLLGLSMHDAAGTPLHRPTPYHTPGFVNGTCAYYCEGINHD